MRSSVVVPVAAALVALSTGPALADPPVPALPPLPAALSAELSPAESTTLARLTAGSGVGVDALVRTPSGAAVVTLDSSTRSAAGQAVALLDAQPGVTAGLTTPVQALGDTGAPTAAPVPWDIARVNGPDATALVPAAARSAVTVAVLDTGIAPHALLSAALVPGRNFSASDPGNPGDTVDRFGHGTHVAGTVAAAVGTVRGVAPGVRLVPVKVLDDSGSGYSDAIARGIVWAADSGADVVTMSIGSPGDDPTVQQAIDYARSRGVVVVAAVGNYAQQGNYLSYPGADQGVIGVGATDSADAWAPFSEHGWQVDLAAPGVGVYSTLPGDTFGYASGTSMATPHVAGAAALVKAADRALTPDQVQDILQRTARDLGAPGRDDWSGWGELDALAAVRAAYAASLPVPQPPTGVVASAGPGSVRLDWAPAPGAVSYQVFRDGAVVTSTGAAGWTDGGLTPGVPHTYAVTATNAAGRSAPSAGVQATPLPLPTAISRLYLQLGGAAGVLGPQTAAEHPVPGGQEADYARGAIVLPSGGAPHAVTGGILAAWAAAGGAGGSLGTPAGDAFGPLRGGGWGQHFARGSVYWSPATGAHTLTGALRDRYAATGWENGLGYPTTDAFGPLRGGGWGQMFQGGAVYWSPATGAHAVTGALRDVYAATGWENGLGYPTAEGRCGLRGGGCLQAFQGGSTYWSPASGAHTVRAQFRDQWSRVGWENGRLGYPTSEVYGVRGGLAQKFQGGTITWTQRTKRTAVAYRR